ncbi:GNAT family N-acetyltransferase [Leisingera sp. ANG59]|uniref:GNAT family N-acetyltransferase n=1 Tax=Leisingera sp. ANG59 TaxID=2675221 RepID=UPI001571780C|nr:GNAT family N-acetyltransferase [Leisingera sp. ANG59]NSY41226.1 GNAT family N-acetyltransferase [Leisingera sp. ANG59]
MAIEAEQKASGSEAELTNLEARHLPGALKLSQEMNWPYRLDDWALAAAAGHGLALERDGQLIGTALWWPFGTRHASAGMIIVTGAEQGRGHGARLFDKLLEATQGRDVMLCSTKEGLALYKRRGFVETGTVVQHQAPLELAVEGDEGIRLAAACDIPTIQEFDRQATGLDRASLVAALAGVGRVAILEHGGRVAGYSVARRFGRGYVVGPVVAESIDDAKRLILEQFAQLHGQFVRIDVHGQHGLSDWLESLGLPCTDRVTAMVKGQQPVPEGAARIYALASQSLG